jgi:hypothetical protein
MGVQQVPHTWHVEVFDAHKHRALTGTLVVLPCGLRKIWDKCPDHGPAPARDAYTGPTYRLNRAYAEQFADRWVILSAKYGFLDPGDVVPGPYDVTFKDRSTSPISVDVLRRQVVEGGLDRFDRVIGLGGKEYRAIVQTVFARVSVEFPFAKLPIGRYMQAVKRATTGTHTQP